MHEMSLAEGILQIVEDTARANAAAQVRAVLLEIGALSHVEEQALRFCFDAVTRGTVADGARLEVKSTPGRAWCLPCGESVALARLGEACPLCGSYQLQVTQGEEMKVKEIEVA
ncbi:MAG TPA: hydrogenase maturation nickel metallochaperone HypA [Burkholderiaceae bacterium]|nr:hydrogenase maturation nickel metallochaperone HypA [Burkholderiaceae bacterium]HQR76833.1 hydrogenase maturation nickel metallochaperone HypA [Burkholderiaceae bacterium]